MSGEPWTGSGCARLLSQRRSRDGYARRGEEGVGLAEALVAIVLLTFAVLSLVAMIATSERVSGFVVRRSQTEIYARRLAEVIRAGSIHCGPNQIKAYTDDLDTYLAGSGGAEGGMRFEVQRVEWTTDQTDLDSASPNPETGNWRHSDTTPDCLTSDGVPLAVRVTMYTESNFSPTNNATVGILQRNACPTTWPNPCPSS